MAEVCGLTTEQSTTAVARIVRAARSWRDFARRNGCGEAETELMGRVVNERTQSLHTAFS